MSGRYLVPLQRYDVDFVVRHGRRWSALEHLVLWKCKDTPTAMELAEGTGMPLRLISECLVNLLRAGWVEFRAGRDGSRFASTSAGAAAAARPQPDHLLEQQKRSGQVYMDLLCGEYFNIRELTVVRRGTPEFLPERVLPANLFTPSPFSPGLVDSLPLRREDAFDRLLGRPRLVPGDLFAVVEVNTGDVAGLPTRTPAWVTLAIHEAVREAGSQDRVNPVDEPDGPAFGAPLLGRGQSERIAFGPGTLVVGGEEHLAAADTAIRAARRLVVIHSTFVGDNIRHLMPALAAAAAAGVQIHVHWGKKDDPEGLEPNASEVAARLARNSGIPQEARHNVHLGRETTGSHAKVILADAGEDGGYCAMIGSCNWLASPYRSVEASVCLTAPRAVALIAGRLAAVLVPTLGDEVVVSRLMDVHGECAARPPEPEANHSAMLVVDEDHYAAVRDAMGESAGQHSVLLGSHKFGQAGETSVLDPMRAAARHGARVRLFYTSVVPSMGIEAAAAHQVAAAQDTVALRRSGERMHAKFLAWRDRLLVTSFNFLSASVNGQHRGGAEIGVLLTGPGIVEQFEAALAAKGVFSESTPGKPVRRRRRGRRQSGPGPHPSAGNHAR